MKLRVLSCSYARFDCVTDNGLLDDFFLNLSFITVFNDRHYEPEVYDPEGVIREKAVVQHHRINLASPQTDIFNLKMNTVKTQDDRTELIPLAPPVLSFMTTKIHKTVSESA